MLIRLTLSGWGTGCLVMMIYVDDCIVADFWCIFLLVIIPVPVAMADAVYPRVAGFTVFLPFMMRPAPCTELSTPLLSTSPVR